MSRGFGLSEQDAYDADPETIAIEYTDGSVYQVLDKEGHIDNTSYLCGGLGEKQVQMGQGVQAVSYRFSIGQQLLGQGRAQALLHPGFPQDDGGALDQQGFPGLK